MCDMQSSNGYCGPQTQTQTYAAHQFHMMKELAVQHGETATMICVDDKAIVPIGEPGNPISPAVRYHNRAIVSVYFIAMPYKSSIIELTTTVSPTNMNTAIGIFTFLSSVDGWIVLQKGSVMASSEQ